MISGRFLRLGLWIGLGLLLRAVALDGDGLWCDEGYSAWTAHLPAPEHEIARSNDDAPPLYYAIQRQILPRLPAGEGSVRLLSAAAGVAGIAWLALQPPFAAAVEAPVAFMALGTYGVYYGRQARSYSLLILWSLILLTAVARVSEGKRRWLFAVAIAEGLALWTHNVAATLVVGANVAWLVTGRREPIRWLAAQAGAFLIWLPYLASSPPQFAVHAELNRWIADFWQTTPLAAAPVLSLAAFTSGARMAPLPPTARWSYDGTGAGVLAVLAYAAVALLLLSAFRKGRRREALLVLSFTLVPLVTLTILSLLTAPSYILSRTDAIAYAGFVVWAGLGVGRLSRPLRVATLTVLALCTLLAIATQLPLGERGRGNDRKIGQRLAEEILPGDWIAFVGLTRPSIDYYVSKGRPGRPDSTIHRFHFPASHGKNPAAVYPTPAESLRVWEAEAHAVRASFEKEAGPGATLFYVGPIAPNRRGELTAAELPYPGNLLAYALHGVRPIDPLARTHGDGMGGDWIAFRIRGDELIDPEELQPVQEAR